MMDELIDVGLDLFDDAVTTTRSRRAPRRHRARHRKTIRKSQILAAVALGAILAAAAGVMINA